MRVEILGSAGAVPIPRPGCGCRVCVQARGRGLPYGRTRRSVFGEREGGELAHGTMRLAVEAVGFPQ